jgi:AAA family ATP:ADP antiporter
MMLVAGGLLLICMLLTNWIHSREGVGDSSRSASKPNPVGKNREGGFTLVLKQRYLLLIALMVLLSNFVNTTGEFILGKVVTESAARTVSQAGGAGLTEEEFIGAFYADFYFWVNLIGASLQLFVVSRLIKYVGVGAALLILPIIAFGSYFILALAPVLGFVRIAKVLENSTDYSVQNTARHALFLKTSREAKYKAKAAIDSFFWRAGDGLSALLVFTGVQFAFQLKHFAIVNALLALVWLAFAAAIWSLRRKNQSQDEKKPAPVAA